ncbi:MAG: O-antigen ligase family protein [Acidobacteriota bacterium]
MPALANLHNLAAVLVGFFFASRRRFDLVVYTGAYVVGAELVWRVCHATLSYESGKYSLIAVFGAGLLAMGRWRPSMSAIIYFALLLPSGVLTIMTYHSEEARQQLSFYLAGPLALAVGMIFLSNVQLTDRQLANMLIAMIGPIAGLAVITLYATLTAPILEFTTESNFVTSGGFGPNQVSSILGLGVFVCMFYALFSSAGRAFRLFITGLMLLCAVQSAMTFSRNGLYIAGVAAVFLGVFGFRLPVVRQRFVLGGLAIAVLATSVILPRLNSFTGGMLEARFKETNTSHRDELVTDDIRIWLEHPVYGVGPGNARNFRDIGGSHFSAHTEFSRMLAEHGIFGAVGMIVLFVAGAHRLWKLRDAESRALTATLFAWTILYMGANAMRVAAPSFAFGLAFMDFAPITRRLVRLRMAA